jgi:poly-gamma-glutamate synthesis protein (capsule biosynthesis protein)
MEANGALYPFERVRPLLEDADLTIANMEGTFTERGIAADKLYTFRTPPRFAEGLAQAGIDLVSLGNNHAMDFGPIGLEDTLAALEDAGIRHAGAGANERAARTPVLLTIDGVRIAFLSYTSITETVFAGPDSSGVARATVEAITSDVRSARAGADAVIVALHSGIEYTDAPQPEQQQLAHAAIDAGAALVLGHHSHTLQGWEHYGDGLIVYSLGNFVFDLDADDLANLGLRAFQSIVLYVTLTADGVQDVRAAPVFIDPFENRPRPATPDEAASTLDRLETLHEMAGPP